MTAIEFMRSLTVAVLVGLDERDSRMRRSDGESKKVSSVEVWTSLNFAHWGMVGIDGGFSRFSRAFRSPCNLSRVQQDSP